jgi:hypothetical protein
MAKETLCEALGLSQEEVQNRVIINITEQIMTGSFWNEDGEAEFCDSKFAKKLNAVIQARIDKAIEAIAAKHILPNVSTYLENICLQETNTWGEKKGKKYTFIEYLTNRAEHYLREEVDSNGKGKYDGDDYHTRNWHSSGETRVVMLVRNHFRYSIENSLKDGLKSINDQIAGGVADTVKTLLKEILEKLQINIKTK